MENCCAGFLSVCQDLCPQEKGNVLPSAYGKLLCDAIYYGLCLFKPESQNSNRRAIKKREWEVAGCSL